jgi:hypothetical protein
MMPKVETFENNIAQEIKRKEASLTEISSASNNVGNDPVELPKKPPLFFIALVSFFVLCIAGLGMVIYFSMTGPDPASTREQLSSTSIKEATSSLQTLSPTLSAHVGRFVTNVEKRKDGYVLTITDYSAVFAYMTRNETDYIEELGKLFEGVTPLPVATTTPVELSPATTPIVTPVIGTTTTSTSSKKQATSTKSNISTTKNSISTKSLATSSVSLTQSPAPLPPETPTESMSPFKDVTISNQNMRVWTQGNRSVVYSFVNNTIVLISNSKEGILSLKSGILH